MKKFIYYDHYSFGEMFAHVSSWFIDNETYSMERAGLDTYRITGNFIDYDSINSDYTYRIDNISWHVNRQNSEMINKEIVEPEFEKIK